jgi:sporadic carbohydrate cluster 2OG-Fe(II) oxygenase
MTLPPEAAKPFFTLEELAAGERFVNQGYVIGQAEDMAALDRIRGRMAELAADYLKLPAPNDPGQFLDGIGQWTDSARLNDLRLHVIDGINSEPWLRPAYFSIGRSLIEALVGNELVMQRRVNLSIQLPADSGSLLPVHADVWSGDSPYEVVLWLPLVDCYRTKAMYLLPPGPDRELQAEMGRAGLGSAEALFRRIEPHVQFIDIRYGEVLAFSQNLMHGNRVNDEATTRWSMNCRFKSALSPYADKKLGEFFEPITLRPATRIGMNYRLPAGFNE